MSQRLGAPLAILYGRLGPYHVARIKGAAALHPSVAVEFFRETPVYAWERVETGGLPRYVVVPEGDGTEVTRVEFARRLFRVLEEIKPGAIAIPGWHHYGSLLALAWALRSRTPTVIMSESQASDARRYWLMERVKSRVVGLFSAALVGGSRQREYICRLGMPEERVFTGCDVIDNGHFAERAAAVRLDPEAHRRSLGLPQRYFLASARLIKKKNVPFLLRSYARYRQAAGVDAADLVILGDGPLRDQIQQLRAALGLERSVHMPGFLQYDRLPAYYALAHAFVHASTVEQWGLVVNEAMACSLPVIVSRTCGCVPELVQDGVNGFTFDPTDEAELSTLLERVTTDSDLRDAMAVRSREVIESFSPATFGQQIHRAFAEAVGRPHKSVSIGDWALLIGLSFRLES